MMGEEKPGALYVVATPIGNLEDITLRALRILREVDWIAAEDARTTRKLLSAHGIHTPLVSYHEQGRRRKVAWIVGKIMAGENVALVSEAGTPGISDPGFELIRECLFKGVEPVAIPGPSALLTALSLSGLPTTRFIFEGFLPRRRPQRIRVLGELRREPRTLVFFESPRRLAATLQDILEVLGNRRAAVARELTKAFEEWRRESVATLLLWAQGHEVRGEVTLLVEGHADTMGATERLQQRVRFLMGRCSLEARDVVRILQAETGLPRKVIYQAVLKEKETRE
jgi:16S rRNA (cytidine1402-2'-O)-methyltransferase